MASEETGLGFHKNGALAFKRYLSDHASVEVKDALKRMELPWYLLYPRIIEAYRGLKQADIPFTRTDAEAVRLWQLLLTDRDAFLEHAPTVYRRLLIAGIDLACHHLVDVNEREGSSGVYKALYSAFPEATHSARALHQEFARLMQSRVSIKRRGKQAVEKRHREETEETKRVVIEQWEKFPGDKSTAATFARHFCGDDDEGAKPEVFRDVISGIALPVKPLTNKTVRRYINEHRKQK
ncbi:MAG: hypothetical protein MI744_13735 [Pseudomonadales bacterium]|nr:hypothetical protein [Pseudomonadales bacterium]